MTKLMHFFNHPFRNKKKQKGVTFLEILAVLVILVLIYLAYARSFGQGTDKARLSDVQNTFKQFQLGFEDSLNENSGIPASYDALNAFLQAEYKEAGGAGNSGNVNDNYLDPWKSNFIVNMKTNSASDMYILVRSAGKDKTMSTPADATAYTGTGVDADDVIMVSHYNNGMVKSCTKGLSKDLGSMNIVANVIKGCN